MHVLLSNGACFLQRLALDMFDVCKSKRPSSMQGIANSIELQARDLLARWNVISGKHDHIICQQGKWPHHFPTRQIMWSFALLVTKGTGEVSDQWASRICRSWMGTCTLQATKPAYFFLSDIAQKFVVNVFRSHGGTLLFACEYIWLPKSMWKKCSN